MFVKKREKRNRNKLSWAKAQLKIANIKDFSCPKAAKAAIYHNDKKTKKNQTLRQGQMDALKISRMQ